MAEEATSDEKRLINLDSLDLRTLQKESTRALLTMDGTNDGLSKFNKLAHHNSQLWYKSVIQSYVDEYGGLPSQVGPAKSIELFSEKIGL
jgi:hypothetical protein